MTEKSILYFERGGPQNSRATLEAAKARALELKPEAVVVTSTTGKTGLEAAQIFAGTGMRMIVAPFQRHLWEKYEPLDPHLEAECRKLGAEFLPDEPAVPMIDDERRDVIRAWYTLSQGFKVAIQVASMCVDTGLLEPGARVIAIAGSDHGADTAIVVRIRGYTDVLKSNVTEIIAIPS